MVNSKKIILLLTIVSLTNYTIAVSQKSNASATANNTKKNTLPTLNKNVPHKPKTVSKTGAPTPTPIQNTPPLPSPSSIPTLSPDKVVLNFENADIQTVIKAISELSGKNFVIDPRVKGTVNIVSDKPISKVDSYKVLEAALRMQGFATVEADGVIKVLPETDAKTYGMRTDDNSKNQQGDQVVTKIFIIQHGSATQLASSLRPLIAPNNSISVYPNTNALIVTDYASNLERINKIINKLSQVNNGGTVSKPIIVTLQNAIASDVAQILQSYINGGSSSGSGGGGGSGGNTDSPGATVTVEANTNSLILYSVIPDKVEELKSLALKIDNNIGSVNSDLHVVYLKNADAAHVADVLRSVVNQQENPDLTASSSQAKFTTEPSSVFGSAGSSGTGGGATGGMGSSASRQSGGAANRNSNNANQKDAPKILVQAEPTTNSLIIQAPQTVYKNLRMIIDMLDIRRAQVMVEAMIADISSTENGTFGVQWLVGGGNNNAGVIGLGNYGGTSSLSGLATTAIGATSGGAGGAGISVPNEVYVGLVTGTTSIGGQTIPTLGALADMISANSVGNILDRPTMLTLDNEEARIMVGQNIGVPNGSFTATSGSPGNLTTTITRQDLGTVLQIKPLITQNGTIQMDIYQEQSSLSADQPINSANGPSFLKRNLRATILVDDGQIIALGGMTEDSISIQQNGVPGLSSIPYIGWLFSWQSRIHKKQNLVLFLRPVIVKNAEGYKALTNQRYNYIMGEQNKVQAKETAVLPGVAPVNLDNQVPYTLEKLPNQGNSSLNLNKSLPVVDLTNNGTNVEKTNPAAISVTTTKITPMAAATKAMGVESSGSTQINALTPGN
jgi:general secretion pathway protein D